MTRLGKTANTVCPKKPAVARWIAVAWRLASKAATCHHRFMDSKRYQVFISSTFKDLTTERQEVIRALMELEAIPAGMELFPASDDDQWTLIKRVIDDSDYYIVIVGGRYGSMDEEGISYTELEYDYAVQLGIPVLGFIHSTPDAIPVNKSDIDAEAREKLAAFRAKVETRMCRPWTTAQDLGGAVSRSLVVQMRQSPGVGWVRGDQAMTSEVAAELATYRARVAELEAELRQPLDEAPEEAAALASGDETYQINFATKDRYRGVNGTAQITHSWNTLIAKIGPLMFDEAGESQIRSFLETSLERTKRFREDNRVKYCSLDPESYNQIMVQLFALGIIDKSVRRRGVSDKQTYWSLTPYGERQVMRLNAIPSAKEFVADVADGVSEDEPGTVVTVS